MQTVLIALSLFGCANGKGAGASGDTAVLSSADSGGADGGGADGGGADGGADGGGADGGADGGGADGGGSDSGPDGAGSLDCAALALSASFDVEGKPTTATLRAALPGGLVPDAVEVAYSDETFRYYFDLDPAAVLDDSGFRWLQPFPAGATIDLSLTVTTGGQRCEAEVSIPVPSVGAETFPSLESTWTYEAYPRPIYITASVRVLRPDGGDDNYIVLVDHLGRYIWSHLIEAPRAFVTPDGVLLLPLDNSADASAPATLTFIGWDGAVEERGPLVEDFHHDFYLKEDRQSLVALSYERLEDVQEECDEEEVLGDVILAVDSGGSEGLWYTSENYPSHYYSCRMLPEKSVSYLNGLSMHDGIISATSSPVGGPGGVVIGYERGGSREFLYLSDRAEESDIPLDEQPACPDPTFSGPHGVVCEASSEDEINCLVHNRRGQDECDSIEWIRVLNPGTSPEATCLISTTPTVLEAYPGCGNGEHHGTFEWLDGRLDDPEGLFGVQFSPSGAFLTGIRASRADGRPSLETPFHILDRNADIMNQANLEAPCIEDDLPCVSSGRFHTLSTGLGGRWELSSDLE